MTPKPVWMMMAHGLTLVSVMVAATSLPNQAMYAQAISPAQIEEVVSVGANGCGPWPLAHVSSMTGCEFAVLKTRERANLQIAREKHAKNCLSCEEGLCVPRRWKSNVAAERQNRRVCDRLFFTPREFGVLSKPKGGTYEERPVVMEFTYTITKNGRVSDIEVTVTGEQSQLEADALRELLVHSAERVRFEPLRIRGEKWAVVEVSDRYFLGGT